MRTSDIIPARMDNAESGGWQRLLAPGFCALFLAALAGRPDLFRSVYARDGVAIFALEEAP